tara:strand:+ start:86 stop:886 length:801 start_codon:yes stop_codon:yes gene_type:complete
MPYHHSGGSRRNGSMSTSRSATSTGRTRRVNTVGTSRTAGLRNGLAVTGRLGSSRQTSGFVFRDTGESYTGRVVELGGVHYSTHTGAKEGTSRELVRSTREMTVPPRTIRSRGGMPASRVGRRNSTGVMNRSGNRQVSGRTQTSTMTNTRQRLNRNVRTRMTPNRRTSQNRMTRTNQNANPVTELFDAPQSPRYYRPDGSIVPIGAPLHRHADNTIMTEHSMGPNDNSVVVTTSSPNNRTQTRQSSMSTNSTMRRMSNGRRTSGGY